MIIKHYIKKLVNALGYNIEKNNREISNTSLDKILKQYISDNPIIFDVGANKGQSIERFSELFNNPIIHSFEPVSSEFNNLSNKYAGNDNIFLNNIALGEKQ